MKILFLAISFILCQHKLVSQITGCTDPQASNYNASATINDGSCQYAVSSANLIVVNPKLSDSISETSGLIWYNNLFYTINDSGNEPIIFGLNQKGIIKSKIRVKNVLNTDWEEITQDSLFIYVGDFGNNDGSRKDLKVLRINKAELKDSSNYIDAETINFSLQGQIDFTSAPQKNHYDMEAFFVLNDTLHLFSKDWVDLKTRHYTLPATPGTYVALLKDSMPVKGLITGACVSANKKTVVLTGYNSSNGACFLWLLFDYKNGSYFNGNKRRIEIGNVLNFGQNEGICYKGKDTLFLTNEKKLTAPSLRKTIINNYLTEINRIDNVAEFKCYPQPAGNFLEISFSNIKPEKYNAEIISLDGKFIHSFILDCTSVNGKSLTDISFIMNGSYILKLKLNNEIISRKIIIQR
ncbi:MAG: T9SS type A sorting domain-containing protein [Bacteroidia bacterium]|nr:T9SS type A sorting domain-containing protein [Bacteroidia bacterium]